MRDTHVASRWDAGRQKTESSDPDVRAAGFREMEGAERTMDGRDPEGPGVQPE